MLCQDDGQPLTRQIVQDRMMLRGARRAKLSHDGRAHPASHVLLAPGDARRAGAGDSGARRARGSDDDAALHAPQSGGARRGDPAAGSSRRGDTKVLETYWRRGLRSKKINESGNN